MGKEMLRGSEKKEEGGESKWRRQRRDFYRERGVSVEWVRR